MSAYDVRMLSSRGGSIRDSRDSTLDGMPSHCSMSPRSFRSPSRSTRTMSLDSLDSDGLLSPLGARFDLGKGTRKIQAFKFKVGDKVEVRDDPAQIWLSGVVHSLQGDGRPRVMRDGKKQAFPFNECRKPLEPVAENDELIRASVSSIFSKLSEGSATVDVCDIIDVFDAAGLRILKEVQERATKNESVNRKGFEAIMVSTAANMKITEDEMCGALLEELR